MLIYYDLVCVTQMALILNVINLCLISKNYFLILLVFDNILLLFVRFFETSIHYIRIDPFLGASESSTSSIRPSTASQRHPLNVARPVSPNAQAIISLNNQSATSPSVLRPPSSHHSKLPAIASFSSQQQSGSIVHGDDVRQPIAHLSTTRTELTGYTTLALDNLSDDDIYAIAVQEQQQLILASKTASSKNSSGGNSPTTRSRSNTTPTQPLASIISSRPESPALGGRRSTLASTSAKTASSSVRNSTIITPPSSRESTISSNTNLLTSDEVSLLLSPQRQLQTQQQDARLLGSDDTQLLDSSSLNRPVTPTGTRLKLTSTVAATMPVSLPPPNPPVPKDSSTLIAVSFTPHSPIKLTGFSALKSHKNPLPVNL